MENNTTKKAFDVLHTLITAYFHQDWTLDYATWQDVVTNFVATQPSEDIAVLANWVQAALVKEDFLISDMNQESLFAWLDSELGQLLSYWGFKSYKEWFAELLKLLR